MLGVLSVCSTNLWQALDWPSKQSEKSGIEQAGPALHSKARHIARSASVTRPPPSRQRSATSPAQLQISHHCRRSAGDIKASTPDTVTHRLRHDTTRRTT